MTFRVTPLAPVEVWAPFFSISPLDESFSRDLHRAHREWRGEDRIWLMPYTEKTERWDVGDDGRFSERLIPAESMNLISVIHVDEGRRTWPPLALPESSTNVLPEGLYRQWLNARPIVSFGPKSIALSVPTVTGDRVSYAEEKFDMEPGPIMPIAGVDERSRSTVSIWPPIDNNTVPPVSPETESSNFFGPLRREHVLVDGEQIDVVVPENDPQFRALNVWLRWPGLLGALFPTGGGADLLYHRGLMRRCIDELKGGRSEEVLRETEAWVGRLTEESEAPLGKASLMPKALADPEALLFELEARFDIAVGSLEELMRSARFREVKTLLIEVRRVHGWLGYFWWEFYCDLSRHVTIRLCQNCGRVIRGGHADRQCCTRLENLECYRQRNAEAQRRGRRRRK